VLAGRPKGRRRPQLARRASLGIALTFLPTFGLLDAEAKAEPIKVKNTESKGKGSLLAAVTRANKDADRDKVTFRSRLSGKIRLRDGLVITKPLKIDGAGTRRLEIIGPKAGTTVTLKTKGTVKSSRIANLKLRRLGIDNANGTESTTTLELFDSGLSGDGARKIDGVDSYGFGLDIRKTKIEGFEGVGVNADYYLEGRITDSSISGNGANGVNVTHASHLTIKRSSIFDNGGNGVSAFDYAGADVINSTISSNGRDGDAYTGGVSAVYASGVRIDSSTINGNGNGNGTDGGAFSTYDGFISLHNSIVAGGPCGEETPYGASLSKSGGGNVIENASGCSGLKSSDVVADARLGRFAKHGGRTPSYSLRPGSPAIGNATKPFRKTDQRGQRRDRHPDSGAFER